MSFSWKYWHFVIVNVLINLMVVKEVQPIDFMAAKQVHLTTFLRQYETQNAWKDIHAILSSSLRMETRML